MKVLMGEINSVLDMMCTDENIEVEITMVNNRLSFETSRHVFVIVGEQSPTPEWPWIAHNSFPERPAGVDGCNQIEIMRKGRVNLIDSSVSNFHRIVWGEVEMWRRTK